MINLLFGLSLLSFTLGQIGRVSLPDKPVFGYIFEIFVYLLLVVFFILYKFKPIKLQNKFIYSAVVFFGWLLLSFVFSMPLYTQNDNIIGFLYFIRLVAYFLFFIYLSEYLRNNPKKSNLFFKITIIAGCIIAFSSIVQYFLYPNIGNIAYLGWDPHMDRLVGVFLDPPLMVSVLALFSILILLILQKKKNIYLIILLLTLSGLIFLTYSRGGYIALFLTFLAFGLRKLKSTYVVLIICVVVAGLLLLPKSQNESINLLRTTSIFTRAQDYQIALDIWKDRPILGIGYNHIRYEKDKYEEPTLESYNPSHASASFHSSFLIILVTGGAVGFILFIWLLFLISGINEYAKYAVIFLSILSFSDNVLLHPFILFLFFIFISLYDKVEQAGKL